MGEGLLGLLGLDETQPPAPPSEAQSQNSSAFRDAIAAVNESLQSAITKATPEDHAALDADRSKLYEAYQLASTQTGQDAVAGQQAMDRVIAAASSLNSKAASAAAEAAAAQQQWGAKEELYDEMLVRVGELEEAGHPKADTLRQLTDTIREKANGHNYSDSAAAVDQLEPKLAAIMQEQQALIEAAKAATNGQKESSWWDKTSDAVSDWFSPDNEKEETNEQATGGGSAPPAETSGGEKSWWEKAKEAVSDVYTKVTGEEEENSKSSGEQSKETGEGGESDDETVIGGDTAALNVQVNFSDGTPASGAPVFCDGEGGKQVSADDSGNASVKLTPGTFTVRSLWGASRAQQQVSITAGQNASVTLTLGIQATLNVTVRGSGSGEPVGNAIVEALGESGKQVSTADPSGAASMVLEPGEYRLRAKSPEGGDWGPATGVILTEGELNSVGLSVPWAGGTTGKIDALKIRSQSELARKSQLLDLGYKEADNIGDYHVIYQDVEAWLERANSGQEFTEDHLTWWSNAISELSFKRRSIAGGRASELHNKVREAANSVAGLRRRLASEKTSLGNIQKAFNDAEDMQEGVSLALALKDHVGRVESLLAIYQDPSKFQVFLAGISETSNQIDSMGDAINAHVSTLAGYVKKQAAQLEGYESMESLVRQISGTVSAIRTALNNLSSIAKKYESAVALEATAG